MLQSPQWAWSESRLVQWVPHKTLGALQLDEPVVPPVLPVAQTPLTQAAPAQSVAQLPQW
jgi:hypothetical protein